VNPRSEPVLDFPDRDLADLAPADYRELGFLCGLEVHQQLRTRTKLFCRCPAGRYVRHFDAEVLRHMRPTLSEMGQYDACALMEFKTNKEIVYRLDRGTVCTYEIDDTPPFPIDEEAVHIALEICDLFDLHVVTELHVMRKQYLDGSIPTGFQRTAMVGLGGAIPFRVPELGIDRDLPIRQLSLEEDSCREVSDVGHRITFRTDRLGMPLTEVVTEPELLDPWEVQAGARLVTRTVRASGKVRRGPGAARQDVNVSVAGGRRIELKGVDHHRGLPLLVHNEAYRQLNLLRLRAELRARAIDRAALAVPEGGWSWMLSPLVEDVTGLLRRSDFAPLREAMEREERAVAIRLPGFAGLLVHRTQPGLNFAGELEDRVRVIACLTSRPCLIHSDIEGYGLSHAEWRHVRGGVDAGTDDAVVVLWGPERDVDTGAREILARATEALEGVPAESRQAFPDGTTGFERILPGAERMYPDTDTPPFPLPERWIEEIREHRAERPWEREDRYRDLGLDPAHAVRLANSDWAPLFDVLSPTAGPHARRVAYALEKRIPHYRRRTHRTGLPKGERIRPLAVALESGTLRPEAFEAALDRILDGAEAGTVLARFRPREEDEAELERRVAEIVARRGPLDGKGSDIVLRWAMGEAMPHLLGRIPPERVASRLREALHLEPGEVTVDR